MARDFDGALPHLQLIADAVGSFRSRWIRSARRRGVLAGQCRTGPGKRGQRFDRRSRRHSPAAVGRFSPTWPRRSPQALCRTTASSCSASIPGWRCSPILGVRAGHESARPVPDPIGRRAEHRARPSPRGVCAPGLGRRSADGRTGRYRDRPNRGSTESVCTAQIRVGDQVALHWDWVCDVINDEQRECWTATAARHLALANAVLAERRPAVAVMAEDRVRHRLVVAGRRPGRRVPPVRVRTGQQVRPGRIGRQRQHRGDHRDRGPSRRGCRVPASAADRRAAPGPDRRDHR